jgi:hypothetical protein
MDSSAAPAPRDPVSADDLPAVIPSGDHVRDEDNPDDLADGDLADGDRADDVETSENQNKVASGARATVLRAAAALAGAAAPLASFVGGLSLSRWLRTEDELSSSTVALYVVLLGAAPVVAAGVVSSAFGGSLRRANSLRLAALSAALGLSAAYLLAWGSKHLEVVSLAAAGTAAVAALAALVASVGLSGTALPGRRVRTAGVAWAAATVLALAAPLALVVRDAAPRAVLPEPGSSSPAFDVNIDAPVHLVLTEHIGDATRTVELHGSPIPGGYAVTGDVAEAGSKWRPGKPVPVIADRLPELTGLGGLTPWAMTLALGSSWEDGAATRSQHRLEQLILAENVDTAAWDQLSFRERQWNWRVLQSRVPAFSDVRYDLEVADGTLERLSVRSPHAVAGDYTELVITFG